MRFIDKIIVLSILIATFGFSAQADFFSSLKSSLTATNPPATNTTSTAAPQTNLIGSLLSGMTTGSASVAALSQEQVASGLKEALSKGVANAVAMLGHNNGFLTNLNVKIPLPEQLQKVESGLRLAGQSQLADQFIDSMNHAAEQAVPVAASVFGDAIKQMSIADAKAILTGPNDAATQFFRRTTQTNLYAKFFPIVQKATDSVGVTASYKAMMNKFAAVDTMSGLFGKSSPVKLTTADIDAYVTNKAMAGLFTMVAAEEKNIRANPVARTTDLLQKVFGSATK